MSYEVETVLFCPKETKSCWNDRIVSGYYVRYKWDEVNQHQHPSRLHHGRAMISVGSIGDHERPNAFIQKYAFETDFIDASKEFFDIKI